MKVVIDTDERRLTADGVEHRLYSKEAFDLLSGLWVKVGWSERYSYTFTWMGRPIIQLPEDVMRVQEIIYQVRPDFIVETGVAHGGSLILYASLCKAMGHGKVIGIDIEIRPQNRSAIEAHDLSSYITLIEGSSTDLNTVAQVSQIVKPGDRALVILDSNHTRDHVRRELELYHPFVPSGSYIVATDGIMFALHDVPGGKPEWSWDNPLAAAEQFAKDHDDFVLEQPRWPFNESGLDKNVTHWPGAWLRRR